MKAKLQELEKRAAQLNEDKWTEYLSNCLNYTHNAINCGGQDSRINMMKR